MVGDIIRHNGSFDKVTGISCDKHGMTVHLKSNKTVPIGEIKIAFPDTQFAKLSVEKVIKV